MSRELQSHRERDKERIDQKVGLRGGKNKKGRGDIHTHTHSG